MDVAQILVQLAAADVLPEEAIRAARLQQAALIPEFLARIEAHAAGRRDWREEPELPFVAFHLLGEWQEKSAYRVLLRFLRSPAVELLGEWTDPSFDPNAYATYYARVLEIPTPRWSTYWAAKLNLPPNPTVPATVQQRAWTSPIWYVPANQ